MASWLGSAGTPQRVTLVPKIGNACGILSASTVIP
jgi:hypothetical protein